MTTLAFTRSGAGAPLVLLHGLGSSRQAWDPVVPALARCFDVIAVDLPGCGDSEPAPAHVEPTVPGWGHVPMIDEPAAVAALIRKSAERATATPRAASTTG